MQDEHAVMPVVSRRESRSPLLNDVAEWLADAALGDASVGDIMHGCSERLLAAGLPLWRSYLGYRTLHPLFASISLTWKRGEDLNTIAHLHENVFATEDWQRSPLNYVAQRRLPFLRRRLQGDEALLDFDILKDLRDQGASDYFTSLGKHKMRGVGASMEVFTPD